MRNVLVFAALAEAVTGLALVLLPTLVGEVLLGVAIDGVAVLVARVAGMALIGLGIACWPGPPALGMLIYSALVAIYLGYLGVVGQAAGVLLWPVVIAHVILAGLLVIDVRRGGGRPV